MIVSCDTVENYMFPKKFIISIIGWIVILGSGQELCIPYGCKIEHTDT